MDKILEYIEKLENGSFECWSEDEKQAYLTGVYSIKKFVEDLDTKGD